MRERERARALAESLVHVANQAGLPTTALLTDMDQPLASAAGNAVEVAYAVDYLAVRRREPRFHAVTVALAAEMLVLGRLAESRAEAERRAEEALASGRAAEAFARMSAALGGPSDLLDDPARHLARAPVVRPIHPATAGVVAAIETREIGLAVVRLGGGRTRPQDDVDPAVGFTALAAVGERVDAARPLGIVHAGSEQGAVEAAAALRQAYRIADAPPSAPGPLVLERLGDDAPESPA
jgi:thymidine phosphorylase